MVASLSGETGEEMKGRLTPTQLYDLVWSEAMQKLARQLGVSGVALAKTCRKAGIPLPERGYWNKLKAGKRVTRARLTPSDLCTVRTVELRNPLPSALQERITGEPGSEDEESIETLTERFRVRLEKVKFHASLNNPHLEIAKFLAKDEQIRLKKASERYYWREPEFDTPFERRRLDVLNALFQGFAALGVSSWVRGEGARDRHPDSGLPSFVHA